MRKGMDRLVNGVTFAYIKCVHFVKRCYNKNSLISKGDMIMKKFLAILLAVFMVFSFAGCSNGGGQNTPAGGDENTLEGTYDITVWVSELDGIKELTQKQIDAFMAENPGIVINATIEGISEADSATQMINDVESGADLYCFAQDQLARLVQAGALNVLGDATAATVKERNDDASIMASTVDGKLYCYPLTSDNGYFMYYDKSVISEDIVDSLEDLVAACEANNRQFSMEFETSAWYNAAFFFGAGCVSEWTTAADGSFVSVNDDFNSDKGLIAMKGMEILAKSPAANSSSDGAAFANAIPSAVVVSGTWARSAVEDILGDNMGVTDLPSFTVDGTSYHLGSFSGNKLMGVKPQTDPKKAAVLQQLALYLTDEKAQLERFELVGWGPSNKAAKENEKVQNDPVLAALAKQNDYATPQAQIHGSWWDIAKVLGTVAKEATSDDDLKAGLEAYQTAIDGLFSMDPAVANAFTVIGSFDGANWDKDYPMSEGGASWVSEPIAFKAGDEFKVRKGLSWDEAYPADNFVVEEDGTFTVVLDTSTMEVTLEK